MRLVFDHESDGFLDEASQLWCIVLKDPDTGERYKFGPREVEQGLRMLARADEVIGHNIIEHDLPLASKLYPWFEPQGKVTDTLVLSRLLFTDLSDTDMRRAAVREAGMTGRHSLEAWGLRFGVPKVVHEDWTKFSPEMLERCSVDVDITERLWKLIQQKGVDPRANELEHRVATIVARQNRYGYPFDYAKAERLAQTLLERLAVLEAELQDTFKPFYLPDGKVVEPKRTMTRKGVEYTAGAKYQKIKLVTFNPGSRRHVAHRLKFLYGWEPKEFTASGEPQIDDDILQAIPWPEAKLVAEYYMVQKRLGLLQGSKQSKGWLESYRNGRIHGDMITNGAVTGRGTHKIIANVPRVDTPYGRELRSLFTASKDRVEVGIDMSGIELRLFAHYLAAYDDGAYGKLVCEGDIHTANQQAAGLPTRNHAKTFIYGWLYGAGDEKIGTIIGKGKEAGRKLKRAFLDKTPGLEKLVTLVRKKAEEKGYLIGLDGRRLHIRKSHAALNTLLQSAGAVLSKQWMVEIDNQIKLRGWTNKVQQLIWVHDELQFDVDPDIAEEFGKLAVECIQITATKFGIRVPLTGEFKIGKNWGDCH
jgi:DNA polymerase I-like protein with 3'-5' exonuclease and polymerase domains